MESVMVCILACIACTATAGLDPTQALGNGFSWTESGKRRLYQIDGNEAGKEQPPWAERECKGNAD